MNEGWIDMSVLKNDTKMNRSAMESGVMFDADVNTDMALFTTKQFGAWIGMQDEEESLMDNIEESPYVNPAEGLLKHANHSGRECKKAETTASTPRDMM